MSKIAPVVKVHTLLLAKAWPAVSLAPVLIVAVNIVLPASALAGANIAVLLVASNVTVPAITVMPGLVKVKLVASVAGSIATLKTAVTFTLIATPVAASAGLVEMMVGTTGGALPPLPPPHPTTKADSSKVVDSISRLE